MNKFISISIMVAVLIVGGGTYFFLMGKNNISSYSNQLQAALSNSQIPQENILDLSNKGLISIPADVFNKTNLEELNVSNNLITGAIQSQISQLKNLKVLYLNNNQMTGVPAEIGQLQNLEVLDLSNNKFTGLPNELGNLKNLKILNLSGNQYSQQDLNVILKGLPSSVNIITDQTQLSGTTVSIKNLAFNPTNLTIKVGTVVVWINEESAVHRIKSALFNSANLNQGNSFSFKFDNVGTYDYSCAIYPSMIGRIVVEQ